MGLLDFLDLEGNTALWDGAKIGGDIYQNASDKILAWDDARDKREMDLKKLALEDLTLQQKQATMPLEIRKKMQELNVPAPAPTSKHYEEAGKVMWGDDVSKWPKKYSQADADRLDKISSELAMAEAPPMDVNNIEGWLEATENKTLSDFNVERIKAEEQLVRDEQRAAAQMARQAEAMKAIFERTKFSQGEQNARTGKTIEAANARFYTDQARKEQDKRDKLAEGLVSKFNTKVKGGRYSPNLLSDNAAKDDLRKTYQAIVESGSPTQQATFEKLYAKELAALQLIGAPPKEIKSNVDAVDARDQKKREKTVVKELENTVKSDQKEMETLRQLRDNDSFFYNRKAAERLDELEARYSKEPTAKPLKDNPRVKKLQRGVQYNNGDRIQMPNGDIRVYDNGKLRKI